jgi:hypothetical protein
MSSYLVRAIESTPNVVVRHRTEVVDGAGDGTLERLKLADRARDTLEEVSAAALFIMIGGEPHTRWLPDEIARDEQGYVITGRDLLEEPGVYWEYDREPLPLETTVGDATMPETTLEPALPPSVGDRELLSLIGDAVLAVDGVARLEPTLKSLFLARVPGSSRRPDSPDGIELTSLGSITDVTIDIAAATRHPSREVAEAVQHVVGELLVSHGREPGRIRVNVLTIDGRA